MFQSKISSIPVTERIVFDILTSQSKLLINHLNAGNPIDFVSAKDLGITHLETRIAELRSQLVQIYERPSQIQNTKCIEYSLKPYSNDQKPGRYTDTAKTKSDKTNAWLKNQVPVRNNNNHQ